CDGYTDERTEAWREEIATVACDAAHRVLTDHGVSTDDIETRSDFRDWHGGKCSHQKASYRLTGGFVVFPADANSHVKSACEAAEVAFAEARDNYITELEAEADQFAAESRIRRGE
ncbi:MAG: hypothetical protein KDA57_18075, partial [Planctomycetales bacterium]|nr:hypothetical protein [Planctomycetales bacterium]